MQRRINNHFHNHLFSLTEYAEIFVVYVYSVNSVRDLMFVNILPNLSHRPKPRILFFQIFQCPQIQIPLRLVDYAVRAPEEYQNSADLFHWLCNMLYVLKCSLFIKPHALCGIQNCAVLDDEGDFHDREFVFGLQVLEMIWITCAESKTHIIVKAKC